MPYWLEFLPDDPPQTITLHINRQGQVVDANLHFDQGETATRPTAVPPIPLPEALRPRRRLTDKQFVEQIEEALDGIPPPGLIKADLAEKTGRPRYDSSFCRRVNRLAAIGKLALDEDGFVDKLRH